nr:immunoglobulin light chain junction region [Macaca mulatta]MOY08681.1 immunoglobulin light chain junction region [Macaca mulatta]
DYYCMIWHNSGWLF